MEVHCTRAEEGRKLKVECKSGRKNIRQRRDAEVGGECAGKFAVRERENDSRSEKERNKARKQESKKARKEEGTARIGCPTEACANFALLLGGGGFGGGVGVLLGEALDATGGVNQLLLAGEEGMAVRADFHAQHVALDGRASLKRVAASAVHRNGMIVGVNTGFHEAPFCRVRSARHLDKVGELQPRR